MNDLTAPHAWLNQKGLQAFSLPARNQPFPAAMPLIVLTGYPSSGKSKRATEIAEYLRNRLQAENRSMKIHVVNDESLNVSKSAYKGSKWERDNAPQRRLKC